MPIFTSVTSLQSFLASQSTDSYVGYSKSKKAYCSLTKDEITKQEQDKRRTRRFAKNIEGILTSHSRGISKAACAIQESQFTSLRPSKYLQIRLIEGKERWVRRGKRKIKAITAGDALLLLNTLERKKKHYVKKNKSSATQVMTKASLKSSIFQVMPPQKKVCGQIVEDDEKPSTSSALQLPKNISMSDLSGTSDSDDGSKSTQKKRKKSAKRRLIDHSFASLSSGRSRPSMIHALFGSDSDDDIEPAQRKYKKASKKRVNVQPSSQARLTTEELFGGISDISTGDESETSADSEQALERAAADRHFNPPAINPRRRARVRNRREHTCLAVKRYNLTIEERMAIELTLKTLSIFSYMHIYRKLNAKYPQFVFSYSALRNEMNRFLNTQNGQPLHQCHKNYNANLMQTKANEQHERSRTKNPHVPYKRITKDGRVTLQNAIAQMGRLHINELVEKCVFLGFPTTRAIITRELKFYAKHLKISWQAFPGHFKAYNAVIADDLATARREAQIRNLSLSRSRV